MNGFNNILKKLFEAMHTGIEYRKSLLSIFYAFFLEYGIIDFFPLSFMKNKSWRNHYKYTQVFK